MRVWHSRWTTEEEAPEQPKEEVTELRRNEDGNLVKQGSEERWGKMEEGEKKKGGHNNSLSVTEGHSLAPLPQSPERCVCVLHSSLTTSL